jgi:regulator of protease activity HflC (stomatin/prohibitin superfamily)
MNDNCENFLVSGLIYVGIPIFGLIFLISLFFGVNSIYTKYNVWRSGQVGKAELMQADWNRQISIREAEAKRESAIQLAQAEIERAKGVAEANKIIGDSLKGNEDYLRYLWIDHLQNSNNQVIYVPTETNLPILEASRFRNNINK